MRDYLAKCLDSIQASLALANVPCEVIVVDSASSDATVPLLAESYPWVMALPQTENVGYTRGNNLGMAAASGEYLFLLNPDTEIVADALAEIVRYLDAHPQVGILGTHTLNTDGTTQSSKRRFPTLLTGLFESTWLQGVAPRRLLNHFYAADVPDRATAEVDWVQGSAFVVRRALYTQIGGLDTDYVMFSEELDYCKRAKLAGWQVIYHGAPQIVHHGGKSTEQAQTHKHIYFQQSKIRYFRKYHGVLAAWIMRLYLILSYAWQWLLEAAKWLIGSRRGLRAARVAMYGQVIRALLRG